MRIGFIGTGNMGGAILKGYANSSASDGNEILIHNKLTEHNSIMAEAMSLSGFANTKIRICNDNKDLATQSDIIILGVKPSNVDDVLREIAPAAGKIIVSMAAGTSIASMEGFLNEAAAGSGDTAKIIRIMPNTPAQVGEAMTAMCRNANVSDEDFALAKTIFDSIGRAEEVSEDLIDCVIGVSGSSPAYTFMYLEALAGAREQRDAGAAAYQRVLPWRHNHRGSEETAGERIHGRCRRGIPGSSRQIEGDDSTVIFEEKLIESERIYEGRILNLRRDKVTTVTGSSYREIVEHNGAVAMVVLTDEGNIIMDARCSRSPPARSTRVKQTRRLQLNVNSRKRPATRRLRSSIWAA